MWLGGGSNFPLFSDLGVGIMMRFLMAMFCAGVGCLLAGCWTVYETPAVALDRSQKFDLNLRLEGFTLTTLQQTGFSSSTANATAYDWQTNTTVTAHGNSTTAHYEYRPDESFSYLVTDVFETLGFNIRSDSPELVLAGRIGDGRFDWSDPWLYLRDGMAALISFPTFMMIGSYERLNDARILIYDINGKRIADYYSEKNCYVFSLAFPFANFANEKAYRWYGDKQAAQFAMADCLNQFLADLKSGKFNEAIEKAKAHYAGKPEK